LVFTAEIQCDEAELAELRRQLEQWLETQGLPTQPAFHVKLVAHEAAKNAIKHSEPCDRVKVRAEARDDEVVLEVIDTNAEPWELEAVTADDRRGLWLIEVLARRMETFPTHEGTALVIALPAG
jgi:anti-sigma regulatory factor (Ser/Thr protein kinase)